MTRTSSIIFGLTLGLTAACNDTAKEGLPAFGDSSDASVVDAQDSGAGSLPDGGAAADAEVAGPADLSDTPTFAVALSDYQSAGIALIDGDGKVLSKKYISSGSAVPGLSSALHGDIALPTQPCGKGLLTILARYGGDYVLQVDLSEGKVVDQVATQGSTGGAAYSSNPQDILCFSDGEALVSRFEPSFDPAAAELDRGDDLLRIDLGKEKRLSRIDLSKLRGKVGADVAYTRPGSMVRVGDYALVGLSRVTASFVAADGLLAIVNLETSKVTGFELPELRQCGTLTPVAGRDDAVIVSCSGMNFGERATAGLMLVSLGADGKATVEHSYQADMKLPAIYGSPVSIGGTRVVAVALGDFTAMSPDVAYVIDLASGEASELFSSALAGELGGGAYRLETGMLLMPDAGQGVRVFKVAEQTVDAQEVLGVDPALPARGIRPLLAL